MAYFPNGTAGMAYGGRFCGRCVHEKAGEGEGGCMVWMLHLIHNYSQIDEPKVREILNVLIPEKDGWPQECSMFRARDLGWDAGYKDGFEDAKKQLVPIPFPEDD